MNRALEDAYDIALMGTITELFTTECIRKTLFYAGSKDTIANVDWATGSGSTGETSDISAIE
jgi:hypothetical protein